MTLTFDPVRHAYHVDGRHLPSITQIIPSDFSKVPPAILQRACERGIAVHKLCELFDLGTLDYSTVSKELEPFLEAWSKFLLDYEVTMTLNSIEVPGYHPVAMYAGTPDRGSAEGDVLVRGVQSVVEIKTVAVMDRKVQRQTAAQKHLLNYWRRRAGRVLIEERWAVKLYKDGKYKAYRYEEDCDLAEFLALTTIMHADVRDGLRRYPADTFE